MAIAAQHEYRLTEMFILRDLCVLCGSACNLFLTTKITKDTKDLSF